MKESKDIGRRRTSFGYNDLLVDGPWVCYREVGGASHKAGYPRISSAASTGGSPRATCGQVIYIYHTERNITSSVFYLYRGFFSASECLFMYGMPRALILAAQMQNFKVESVCKNTTLRDLSLRCLVVRSINISKLGACELCSHWFRLWLVAYLTPGHYPNECVVPIRALRTKSNGILIKIKIRWLARENFISR